ncbi:unnamed protein product [Urochloa humidicola]
MAGYGDNGVDLTLSQTGAARRERAQDEGSEEERQPSSSSAVVQAFVKVSMDGTLYLRKVDVAAYDDYAELVEALNELFCCCSIGTSRSYCPGALKKHVLACKKTS